jgi:type I restriction enzyme M protein
VRENQVLILNSKTCGINKDGNELYCVNSETGERDYTRLDDQLTEDCIAVLKRSDIPRGTYIPLDAIIKSSIAIPMYYNSEYAKGIEQFCKKNGFDKMSLGELYNQMLIEIFHGHGSPSADQRIGDVPYIKVSDLRAGTVNVNSTNQIPIALARKYWKNAFSGLQAYDILSPERASKNIGEFCILMPGQEQIVLTKEIIGLRSKSKLFDQFYLMWALSLPVVRHQWERIIFMQTNREDVGKRFYEIEIPIPRTKEQADVISSPYRKYYKAIEESKKTFTIECNELVRQFK